MRSTVLQTLAVGLMLSACAPMDDRGSGANSAPEGAGEAIDYALGPCFGTCPVYSVDVRPDGVLRFDGGAHAAASGERLLPPDPATYRAIAAALAPYRPPSGTTAQTECEQRVSDQQSYAIRWTGADGTVTTLNHDGGCLSERNRALVDTIRSFPARFGFAEWVSPTR